MGRAELFQEIRKMRFESVYTDWRARRLTQEQAAMVLGVCARTFRRQINRFEENGVEGLLDKRLTQIPSRRAPVDELFAVCDTYKKRYQGWNVAHFHSRYKSNGGQRSYTWVKNTLQSNGLVNKASKKGKHRKRREPAPIPGMMLHQDASNHQWVEGKKWDLVVTMDDATNEHYSMFFVYEEGTASSFRGVKDVISKRGLFSSLYTDRGSHYWYTPQEGGKVSKTNLTQFGRAMASLAIQMIPSYSPQARGRSERAFRTHQDRLPRELAANGITTMEQANQYLAEVYLPAFNAEFMRTASEKGTAFMQWVGSDLDDILCEQYERTVNPDNCVSFEGKKLQIPPDKYRCHYVKARVRVHKYIDGSLAVFHGPRKLADYDSKGKLKEGQSQNAA
ncbi:MAG: ISNCY family transposase [Desulfomonilaceae bacterium]